MRLKARRGAVVVLLGIMIVALVSISAIAIDFSRLWALRNELQTSADAAAHAGAVQLSPPNNASLTMSVASSYANANLAMQGTVTVDSMTLGDWDDDTRTFAPDAPYTDAISVVVSRQATGLIMGLMGVPPPRLKARAIGWSEAPVVTSTGCIKPVAVPMAQLMYKLNTYRGIANTPDTNGLYRPFDQVEDMEALANMTAGDRTFNLKIGTGQLNDTLGAMSGQYQAVQLGPYKDANGNLLSPGPTPGVQSFKANMAGGSCHNLSVGQKLLTQSGLGDGQVAICGAWPGAQGCGVQNYGSGICSMIRGDQQDPTSTPQSSSNFGNCEDSDGNVGIDMKAVFYRCMSACNGQSEVEVTMLGSFTMTKVFPDNAKQQQNPYTTFSKAEIQGIFKPVTDPGTVGPGSTTLQKPIIVR